ncbi:uncharacterized protein [Drosophila virilis]|uniref:Uncharacterized protein n=1 Tax=Drosophila virilis TaxID=7244 RepID=B4LHZ1_DROVI|nr:uncharacterized protein LOC6623637 [Drosophila virilis]EDW68535.1 uncharacterized protein Dvir_GJ12766 [Drosophila virilis]
MYKLFILLSLCVAIACAAPGLLHATPILGSATSYHILPHQQHQHAVHVVRPIWPTHQIVRPIIHGGAYGHGHGHGWL